MSIHSTADDEVLLGLETAEAFERSSRLFYAADKIRYETQDEAGAEKMYREAMAATSTHGTYYHLAQGQIYSMRQNMEYALTEFEIAAEINAEIDSVFVNLGLTYRKLAGQLRSLNLAEKAAEMTSESVAALNRALEIDSTNAGAWSALAITYLTMGEGHRNEAERCLATALDIDPNSYLALTALTNLRRLQGRKEEARQHALAAIALRPQLADAYGMLGSRESATRRLEEKPKKSIEWLIKALARQPNNAYYMSEMAKAHRELGEYAEAVAWFDKALKADTSGDQQYGKLANRADAYRLAKQFDLAETDLRRALAIRPDYTFAIASLMKLCKECRRHEEGVALADALVAKNDSPQNRQQQKELSALFQRDRKESIEITQHLIQAHADVTAESTRTNAERARQLHSRNHDAWGIIGRCLAARADFGAAQKHLDHALTLKPDAYFYRLILGQVLEELGEWSAAEREYQAFSSRAANNERGKEGLRRVREHLRRQQRRKQQSGTDAQITFINNKTGREERHPIKLIREFLYDRMNDWSLPIRDIIEEIGEKPVFIIAKTGVGKTVTVPTKVLLGLCDALQREGQGLSQRSPQVYVVEPRIPICTMMMAEMNEGYQQYLAYRMKDDAGFRRFLQDSGVVDIDEKDRRTVQEIVELAYKFVAAHRAPYDPRHFNLYGCITSAGKINGDAPILFITTGIMESLTFEGDKLDPRYHRIIIDEAHVTIEANPAIELGIALARKQHINIDYMSATVAPGNLETDLGVKIVYAEAQRFPIHLTNLKATVEESILDLVQHFLVDPEPSRFPNPGDFRDPTVRAKIERVRTHLLSQADFEENGKPYRGLKNRPQGMLVIVNSHQSENSDTHRIADLIARADFNRGKTRVHTLRLASPVVRDPSQKLAFDRLIKNIEDQNGRYVIVATNVVEMGLTFSSLDYVVTMDSEFDTVFVDGGEMIRKVELGVNALYQRIGRAGRIRPGMAFIARDFGASYCNLDDATLAAGLPEAPISYPLAKGSFLKLALYSFREGIPEPQLLQAIKELCLPSHIENDRELWQRFLAERARLTRIGIRDPELVSWAQRANMLLIRPSAWLDLAEGRPEQGIEKLRAAADQEHAAGFSIPAAEMLGDILVAAKRPQDAIAAYEQALKVSPGRFNSLYGAANAAELAGNTILAIKYYSALQECCNTSSRPEVAKAKRFVSSHKQTAKD
jgi:tetratricopeptide (TPR) repeat protein